MQTLRLDIQDSAFDKVMAVLRNFSADEIEINPIQSSEIHAQQYEKTKIKQDKLENPFNYDLERMKERVENQEFVAMPKGIKTIEEFDKWLASDV